MPPPEEMNFPLRASAICRKWASGCPVQTCSSSTSPSSEFRDAVHNFSGMVDKAAQLCTTRPWTCNVQVRSSATEMQCVTFLAVVGRLEILHKHTVDGVLWSVHDPLGKLTEECSICRGSMVEWVSYMIRGRTIC